MCVNLTLKNHYMPVLLQTLLLLFVSNVFMLSAWYLHLKLFGDKHWYIVVLISWGIAFIEYNFHIPANRIGSQQLSVSQLQILQIGMSLLMFIPFSIFVMNKPIKLDYIYAMICLFFAAFFIFRK